MTQLLGRVRAPGPDLVAATPDEQVFLRGIQGILGEVRAAEGDNRPMLLGMSGEKVELPESVFLLLCQIVPHLMAGHAVSLVSVHQELTTQEAADLLNVSRPFLIGLLERGEIPYIHVGKHRRIRFGDLLAYKERRDAARRQHLDRLTRLSQEYGLDRYGD